MKRFNPEIRWYEILLLNDKHFTPNTVCLITGAGNPIGRATAFSAAKNNLFVVGFDADESSLSKTEDLVASQGGKMVSIVNELDNENDINSCLREASTYGSIRYLANLASPFRGNPENSDTQKNNYSHLLMSRLAVTYMAQNKDNSGVIANLAGRRSVNGENEQECFSVTTTDKEIENYGHDNISQTRIRSFSIHTGLTQPVLKRTITQNKERKQDSLASMPKEFAPIEAGNMILFGFSIFSKYLAFPPVSNHKETCLPDYSQA